MHAPVFAFFANKIIPLLNLLFNICKKLYFGFFFNFGDFIYYIFKCFWKVTALREAHKSAYII